MAIGTNGGHSDESLLKNNGDGFSLVSSSSDSKNTNEPLRKRGRRKGLQEAEGEVPALLRPDVKVLEKEDGASMEEDARVDIEDENTLKRLRILSS